MLRKNKPLEEFPVHRTRFEVVDAVARSYTTLVLRPTMTHTSNRAEYHLDTVVAAQVRYAPGLPYVICLNGRTVATVTGCPAVDVWPGGPMEIVRKHWILLKR